jgi:hypothetical protein
MNSNKIKLILLCTLLSLTRISKNTNETAQNNIKTIIYSCNIIVKDFLNCKITGGSVQPATYDKEADVTEGHEHTEACLNHPEIHMIRYLSTPKSKGRTDELTSIIAYHLRNHITNPQFNLNNYLHIFSIGGVNNDDTVYTPPEYFLNQLIAVGHYIQTNNINPKNCLMILSEENHYTAERLKTSITKQSSLKLPYIHGIKNVKEAIDCSLSFIKNHQQSKITLYTIINSLIYVPPKLDYQLTDYKDLIASIFFDLCEEFNNSNDVRQYKRLYDIMKYNFSEYSYAKPILSNIKKQVK